LKKGYSFCGRCGRKYVDDLKQRPPMNPGSTKKPSSTSPEPSHSSVQSTEELPSSASPIPAPQKSRTGPSQAVPLNQVPLEQPSPMEQVSIPQTSPLNHDSSAELSAASQGSSVQSTPLSQESSVQSTPVSQESSVQSTSVSQESSVQSTPVSQKSSVQSTPVKQPPSAQSSSVEQSPSVAPSPAREASTTQSSPVEQTSSTQSPVVRQPSSEQSSPEEPSPDQSSPEQSSSKQPSPENMAKSKDEVLPEKKTGGIKIQLRVILVVALVCILLVLLVISIFMQSPNLEEAEGEGLPYNVEGGVHEAAIVEDGEVTGAESEEIDVGLEEEEQGIEVLDIVVIEEALGSWVWLHEDSNEGNLAFSLVTYYFNIDGSGERSINGQYDEFSWGATAEGVLVFIWDDDYFEKWDFTIREDIIILESEQNDGMEFTYRRIATEGHEELVGRWGWSANQYWYYLFEMGGHGSRTDSYFLGRDEFIWFLLADGGLILRIGEEPTEEWDYEINYEMLTLSSRQERGIEFHYIRLE